MVPFFFPPQGPEGSRWGDSMGLFVSWVLILASLLLAELKSLSLLQLP